ncbi:hypothetical protein FRC04_008239, partial [Tulasnella sp. 424]
MSHVLPNSSPCLDRFSGSSAPFASTPVIDPFHYPYGVSAGSGATSPASTLP